MKPQAENPIGIFDSGMGGLTIFKAVKNLLPRENLIYFGDTAHVPYGSKSKETVTKYSLEIAGFLEKNGIKLLVVACNTASALAAEKLRKTCKVPVVEVITPGANAALKNGKNKKIAVIATESTVNSKAYVNAVKKAAPKATVTQTACPLFVPLIEEGYTDNKASALIIEDYLKDIKKNKADTLILGCTHYPIIKKNIKKFMGPQTILIDSAEEVAHEVKKVLSAKNLLANSKTPKYIFYTSDSPERFAQKANSFLGLKIKKVNLKKFS